MLFLKSFLSKSHYFRCGCGYPSSFHKQDAIDNHESHDKGKNLKWNAEEHTIQDELTDAYGDLKFVESKYALAKVN